MKADIWLPFPPSTNTYWRHYRGRTIIGKQGKIFREAVMYEIMTNKVPTFGTGRLRISMILRPRDKRRIDIDNRIKATLDALEHAGVFEDDCQIDRLEIERGEPTEGGCIQVTIEEISPRQSEGGSSGNGQP
jgi:crossover junction endodeoxyribonuclease RusA